MNAATFLVIAAVAAVSWLAFASLRRNGLCDTCGKKCSGSCSTCALHGGNLLKQYRQDQAAGQIQQKKL